jgi:hypothetical protein
MRSPLRVLRTFRTLPRARRRVLRQTAPILLLVRVLLWTLPSGALVRRIHGRAERAELPRAGSPSLQDLVWAVEVTSRHVPAATCLTQALATQVLLARWGYGSTLRIGVARETGQALKAHAWVERNGEVLIGGGDLERYTQLPDLFGAL